MTTPVGNPTMVFTPSTSVNPTASPKQVPITSSISSLAATSPQINRVDSPLSPTLSSSQDLAHAIHQLPSYASLAHHLIQAFETSHQTPGDIQELALLAGCGHPKVVQDILNTLTTRIKTHTFIHSELFLGLATAISSAQPKSLNSDDLVQIVKLLTEKLSQFHQDKSSETLLQSQLQPVLYTLEAISDANVIEVSRTDVFEPLYDQLDHLAKKNQNEEISILLQCCRQASLRLAKDETKLAEGLRRTGLILQGGIQIGVGIYNISPGKFLEAFKSFKQAFHALGNQKEWYDDLRAARLLPSSFSERIEKLPFDQIKALKVLTLPNISSTTHLLDQAKTNLEWRIAELRAKRLGDKDLQQELSLYIPPQAYKGNDETNTFDLTETVNAYLSGSKKVLHLLGGPGSGKTLFLRSLEQMLWKQDRVLPLFIRLSSINPNSSTIIEDALKTAGFTPSQITALKDNYKLVILFDGYDEMSGGKLINLYNQAELKNWKCQTVITSRPQHFINVSDASGYFVPFSGEKRQYDLYEEMTVAPFTDLQIDNYLTTYVKTTNSPWDATQYRREIEQIPGLRKMIGTPFLLKIVAEVLPEIVARRSKEGSKQVQLTRSDLYDTFVEQLFRRQETKLRQNFSQSIPFYEEFNAFCEALAQEMVRQNITEVHYEKKAASDTKDPFADFFEEKTLDLEGVQVPLSAIRSACPLIKTGPHSWAFVHKSLLEYFGARAAFNELQPLFKGKSKHFGKVVPLVQPSQAGASSHPDLRKTLGNPQFARNEALVQLFADRAQKISSFKEELLAIIDASKKDSTLSTAAVNAKLILDTLKTTHLSDVKTTEALAGRLASKDLSAVEKSFLIDLAQEVVRRYQKTFPPTAGQLQELATLAQSGDAKLTQVVLENLIDTLIKSALVDPALLKALAFSLREASPKQLVSDDLVKILKALQPKLKTLHLQDKEKLLGELKALAVLLDAMGDLGVTNLNRKEIVEPLDNALLEIGTKDERAKHIVEYCRQSLTRLPQDVSKPHLLLQRAIKIGEGLKAFYDVYANTDPLEIKTAFASFQEAFQMTASKRDWYEQVRFTQMMIENNQEKSLTDYLASIENPSPYLMPLVGLFRSDLATPLTPSTDLVVSAQASASWRLALLYDAALHPSEDAENQALYTSIQATYKTSSDRIEEKDKVDLEEAVLNFIKSDKSLFLLKGHSGSGKSMFTVYQHQKLWKEFNGVIPLWISLTGVDPEDPNLVENHLAKMGFSLDDIQGLKQNREFVIFLDGYDEMKPSKREVNLYDHFNLSNWKKVHVILSCRTDYLRNLKKPEEVFAPHSNGKIQYDKYQEITTVPFSDQQIDIFLQKYVSLGTTDWEWQKFRQYIDVLPGLKALIETPFVLKILTEVLPRILKSHSNEETLKQLKLTRADLYAAFIDQWFERQQDKLIRAGKISLGTNAKDEFIDFAKRLAAKMTEKGLTEVDYTPSSRYGKQEESEWENFFGSKKPEVVRARYAAPLRKTGESKWAFMHKSFQEYLATAKIFDEIMLSQEALTSLGKQEQVAPPSLGSSSLNQRLLTKDASMLQFWADNVKQKAGFKEQLFEVIEKSKKDASVAYAAANAITILNMANVSFSCRDFKGIKIPGANLEGANLVGVDLTDADLTNTVLTNAVFSFAKLDRAQMQGVVYSQRPAIPINDYYASALISSADQKQLIGAVESDIYIWDSSSQKEVKKYQNKDSRTVTALALVGDGKILVSGNSQGEIVLRDLATDQVIRTLKGHTNTINSLAYFPAMQMLASASDDHTIRLWDVSKGELISVLEGHTDRVVRLSVLAQHKYLASVSADKSLRIWDLSTGKLVKAVEKLMESIYALVSIQDGKFVAVAGESPQILIINGQTGDTVKTLQGHTKDVTRLALLKNQQVLLSSSADSTIRLWDINSGETLKTIETPIPSFRAMTTLEDDTLLATSGGSDRQISFLDLSQTQGIKKKTDSHTTKVNAISYLAKRNILATAADRDSAVRLLDFSNGETVHQLEGHTYGVFALLPLKNEELLASGGADTTIRVWNLTTNKIDRVFKGHTDSVTGLAILSDEDRFVSGSYDKTLRIWNLKTGECEKTLKEHKSFVYSLISFANSRFLASGSQDSTIRIWDPLKPKSLKTIKGNKDELPFYVPLAYSEKNKLLASSTNLMSEIHLRNPRSGKIVAKLSDPEIFGFNSLAYLEEWNLLASLSRRVIALWDLKTKQVVFCFTQPSEVSSLQFKKPDTLLTGDEVGGVWAWKLKKEEKSYKVELLWTTKPSLYFEKAHFTDASNLSKDNKLLMEQHGATEYAQESTSSGEELPEKRCNVM